MPAADVTSDGSDDATVVAVLGQRLRSPELHEELRGRVDVALDAVRATDADYLLATGGRTNPVVDRSEADAVREYAVERGVDPDRVLLEPRAADTIENAYYARLLVEELDQSVERLLVVTSCYHARRAAYVFEQCFGDACEIDASRCYDAGPVDDDRREAERESLRRAREFFDAVPAGDLDALRRQFADADARTVPD